MCVSVEGKRRKEKGERRKGELNESYLLLNVENRLNDNNNTTTNNNDNSNDNTSSNNDNNNNLFV